ncbi:NifB/NifX family molybdenum-iron cluster-binding protein [Thermodesulfobacteriota bacterium]
MLFNDFFKGDDIMRIAIPVLQGRLAEDFEQCREVDIHETLHQDDKQQIFFISPTIEPWRLPLWFQEHDVDVMIAGKIDEKTVFFLEKAGIKVIKGAPPLSPKDVVRQYLTDQLILN